MENYRQQAARIKSLRIGKGLSQGQLSYLIGVSQSAIAKIEKRGCKSVATASKIAQALGVSLDTFRV